ncbi:hypothetical protein GO986_12160 [Deinococcus sp. HMF7620]|uniref:Uncharacterized protein n=1 Tax=Deinococcus arboris TaxID=2682977 RepID=A0A7C9M9A4_9DEIO|nr:MULTISPECIES: hypothetical protein [Deinococcus]MBZ9752129.1 hypothetical protein [Deinococcus betulae]MVN87519.1 hypothetical protein [Deinococcus arboris]
MQIHQAASRFTTPRPVPLCGIDHLLQAGAPASAPQPGDTPAGWAVTGLLRPSLMPLVPLDCTCRVYRADSAADTLSVSFERDTYGVRKRHIGHLPDLYAGLPPDTLGSVLHHLNAASMRVWPIFTPEDALHYLHPMADLWTVHGQADAVRQVAWDYGLEGEDVDDLEAGLADEGVTSPRATAQTLRPYCAPEPLSLAALMRLGQDHAHLGRVLRPLQTLVALDAQLPTMTWADREAAEAGPHTSATVVGATTLLALSNPGDEALCTVEHALSELGDQGINTSFAPHWAVHLNSLAAAERLLTYIRVAPRVARAAQAVVTQLTWRPS